ncbi:MAG: UDP-glucose--hexose-1-phosphate uridylyltransferase [Candidatus Latescibacteria bacterium]|nr:UDP-glucose--hexose-1-phosphate uridylyltransferase [Candidatus Latescibacterota bacterium]
MELDLEEHPHRRYNPLSDEWVLVSPHRSKRPWQGRRESVAQENRPAHDSGCYLCPGNERAGGARNPDYSGPFVFSNDFAALLDDGPIEETSRHPLLRARGERGACRVVCFSPRHDLSLAEMAVEEIAGVVRIWGQQVQELGPRYPWVQVFENKGEIMGCSNPHPHGQIWASSNLPDGPAREDKCQRTYQQERGQSLLVEYAELESQLEERVVVANQHWLAVVPYWAVWPFETLVLPRQSVGQLTDLDAAQEDGLAQLLKGLLVRYDNLFETSFPYSMGWHGRPFLAEAGQHWQLHAHFYPPLLRSAQVKKFMVGYEMLAEAQRDLTPEKAAAQLRELPAIHYRERV